MDFFIHTDPLKDLTKKIKEGRMMWCNKLDITCWESIAVQMAEDMRIMQKGVQPDS